jgi:2',3'-cyclic-nucleotide 3'-phosphodiesterase
MHTRPPSAKSPLSYPQFQPHVTLTTVPSTTPIDALLAAIPANQRSIRADFDALQAGDHYFRSVYIEIHKSDEFIRIHKDIHEKLGIKDPKTPKYPHMSVYYIADSEPEERTRVHQELIANGTAVKDDVHGGIAVDCSKGPRRDIVTDPEVLTGFDGAEIWAALCDGPVETWTVEVKVKLD